MKHNKYLLLIIVILFLGSCQDFEELEKDPNRPTSVSPGLVLNGVLNDMSERAWNNTQRWNQFNCCNYNYYGNQEYNWTTTSLSYTTLKNVVKMEEEALAGGAKSLNPYSALGKFFRAYFYYRMTMLVGDLPQEEALQGLEELTPKYDSQKQIFGKILNWLDTANTDIAALISSGDNTLSGDFYYNNDLRKWQKAVNSFKIRVLVQLSKKETDGDLNIKAKFAEVLSNKSKYPLFESNLDNLQYVYNSQFNKYPINPDNFGFDATRYNYSSTYLNKLSMLKDPRVFIMAEPAGEKLKSGLTPTSYEAFVGADPNQDLGDMSSQAGIDNGAGYLPGKFSFFNRKRFYSTYTAENTIQIGYAELCFNIAEGIHRGWATGNAEEWYVNGIQASQRFYGLKEGANDVYFFRSGGTPTNSADYDKYTIQFNWEQYYAQTGVKYEIGNAGLEKILTQKYLAFFQNSGWEAYFNSRRTGVPAFSQSGPGTGNSGKIPRRFQYPSSELTTNTENLNEALSRQFGGKDDINLDMWVIK
jgi:Starch-binding associating with outer membrane